MKKRYAIHPEYVTSQTDGDRHYIDAQTLVRLYNLKPHEYVVWQDRGMREEDFIHLYPRQDGNYTKPPLE